MRARVWTALLLSIASPCLIGCHHDFDFLDHLDAGEDAPADAGADAVDENAACRARFGECNPVNNDGCDAGQKCYAPSFSSYECIPQGPKQLGDPCNDGNQCREGLECVNPGTCLRFCCSDDDCTDTSHGGAPGLVCKDTYDSMPLLKLCATR